MFWLYYLLPAAIAASMVWSDYGALAGLATLIVVPALQSALLFWVSDRVTGMLATKRHPANDLKCHSSSESGRASSGCC